MGKDFLEKRSRIFLLLLLMEGLMSGWLKISREEKKNISSFSVDGLIVSGWAGGQIFSREEK